MAEKRVVVKFGGAELRSGESFRQAAEMIKTADFEEVVVVVSAMEKSTDNLINCVKSIGGISDADYADIVSMGERISARIFSAALKALGINSVCFDPQSQNWPVITNSNFLEAEPNLEETRRRVKLYVEPLLGSCVPVVCGFLGRDPEGRVTLLGRGGSDITATLLGNCLNADEVILVKNTEGVLSADPKLVPEARPLKKVSVEEMFSLAQGGAKIVHPKALKYKLPHQKLKVASFNNGLSSEGTEIVGAFSNLFEIRRHNGLCAVTLVGELNATSLGRALMTFANEKVVGLSTGRKSVTIFANVTTDQKALLSQLCQIEGVKGVSIKENIGAIEVLSPDFIESPGWVAKISSALAEKGINIVEISSSKATITVFLEEKDLEKAMDSIKAVNH
ncbi:MAG: aspartate kinase [Candidatus Bathyarchaeia archaeon]|nr:aspartate kinase [Candidatus Bathyarchaeota archaeon]